MNGMYNPIVFYPAAVLMILFAILAIKFKNIFYSLLSAILVFFFAGFFFYILGSEYNAVIQIAIYGIAVPVVLGLAVMFTNLKKDDKAKSFGLKYLVIFVSCIFVLALVYLIMTSLVISPIGAFGHGIFVKYVWAFELVSLILTIIVAGLTLFNRANKEEE